MLKKLSGHIGKQLVFKQYGDKTVVSKYPDMSKRMLTPKQLKVNDTMAEANYAAKVIMATPVLIHGAQVGLKVTSNRLYRALIREFFENARDKK